MVRRNGFPAKEILGCAGLMLLGACTTTDTFQMALQPTYVATPLDDGSLHIALTVTSHVPKASGGAEIPFNDMLDNASRKECPDGYEVRSREPSSFHNNSGIATFTVIEVIRCK